MTTDRPMQLGMIGLGRMGANLVRRLMRDGHRCVVYDIHPPAVEDLAGEAPRGRARSRTSSGELDAPRHLDHGAGGRVVQPTLDQLVGLLSPDDVIIDGGNSYYRDDITRAKALTDHGLHYVDCGTSGGVWGLDRGYCLMIGGEDEPVETARSDLQDDRAGCGQRRAHPWTDPHRRDGPGRLPALRPERRRPLREDGPQRDRVRDDGRHRRRAQHHRSRQRATRLVRSTPRPPRSVTPGPTASTSTWRVAEVWRRGSVVGSWLVDLTAGALARSPKLDDAGRVSDSGGGRWTVAAAVDTGVPPASSRPRSTSASSPEGRATSRTRSSRP